MERMTYRRLVDDNANGTELPNIVNEDGRYTDCGSCLRKGHAAAVTSNIEQLCETEVHLKSIKIRPLSQAGGLPSGATWKTASLDYLQSQFFCKLFMAQADRKLRPMLGMWGARQDLRFVHYEFGQDVPIRPTATFSRAEIIGSYFNRNLTPILDHIAVGWAHKLGWSKTEVINGATVKKPLAVMMSGFDVVDNIQATSLFKLIDDELARIIANLSCRNAGARHAAKFAHLNWYSSLKQSFRPSKPQYLLRQSIYTQGLCGTEHIVGAQAYKQSKAQDARTYAKLLRPQSELLSRIRNITDPERVAIRLEYTVTFDPKEVVAGNRTWDHYIEYFLEPTSELQDVLVNHSLPLIRLMRPLAQFEQARVVVGDPEPVKGDLHKWDPNALQGCGSLRLLGP